MAGTGRHLSRGFPDTFWDLAGSSGDSIIERLDHRASGEHSGQITGDPRRSWVRRPARSRPTSREHDRLVKQYNWARMCWSSPAPTCLALLGAVLGAQTAPTFRTDVALVHVDAEVVED